MRTLSILSAAIFLLFAATALGADLAQAKRDGLIGERADGFLGMVQANVPADVAALVANVNDRRRAEYRRIATENGVSVEDVQARAGQKAIERTGRGGWVLDNGGWRQK